jgi:hypothetical protein
LRSGLEILSEVAKTCLYFILEEYCGCSYDAKFDINYGCGVVIETSKTFIADNNL